MVPLSTNFNVKVSQIVFQDMQSLLNGKYKSDSFIFRRLITTLISQIHEWASFKGAKQLLESKNTQVAAAVELIQKSRQGFTMREAKQSLGQIIVESRQIIVDSRK